MELLRYRSSCDFLVIILRMELLRNRDSCDFLVIILKMELLRNRGFLWFSCDFLKMQLLRNRDFLWFSCDFLNMELLRNRSKKITRKSQAIIFGFSGIITRKSEDNSHKKFEFVSVSGIGAVEIVELCAFYWTSESLASSSQRSMPGDHVQQLCLSMVFKEPASHYERSGRGCDFVGLKLADRLSRVWTGLRVSNVWEKVWRLPPELSLWKLTFFSPGN